MSTIDPTDRVQSLAKRFCGMLGENWDELREDRKMAYRRLAFGVFESLSQTMDDTMRNAVVYLEGLMQHNTTPKSWLVGIRESSYLLRDLADDTPDFGVNIPDVVPDDLTKPDPYTGIKAGDWDPYKLIPSEEEQCAQQGPDGWECTREPHPPHWVHWDADRDVESPLIPGKIHVTWFESVEGFDSIEPMLLDGGDDD